MAGRGGNKKEWVNVMRQEGLDDMVLVSEVTNDAIAKNLRVRYDKDIIYTNIGQVLISMNPYKWLEIYNDSLMDDYIGKPRIELPPHVFGVAEEAYRAMKNDNENQCVIISGESGAGKTEAAKKVMEYIAYASSNAPEVQRVKKIILATNPILESFGNAKTLRNDNSSRFGKYFEIQFNQVGDPVGGVISNFLLEKSRVVGQIAGERNFHIFYQVTKGANARMQNDLGLSDPRNFTYICGTTDVPTINDLEWWAETQEACQFIGMTAAEQWELWSVVAAILWTGNLEFNEKGDTSSIKNNDVLEFIAGILGVPGSFLGQSMTIRQMQTSHGAKAGSTYSVPLNRRQAEASRDALSKAIYDRIFDWIIDRINKALATSGCALSIGVLDIYGFEIFDKNGFEQLCINFINEKLQQIFIELTLKLEQEEYVKENIKWTPIKFFNNKIVCDLLEAKNPPGIFSVLNDVCRSVHSADADKPFMDRLNSCSQNAHFQHRNRAFLIKHYAGDVTYEGYGMVEKNKDTLFKDLLEVIKLSSNTYLSRTLFPEEIDPNDKRMPETAAVKITRQADRLVQTLMKSQPHYVRCIKPNDLKAQNTWNHERVMHQIVYLGLLDNLRVRRAGFAFRAPFKKFMERYFLLSKQCSYAAKKIWKGDDVSGCQAILKDNHMAADQFQIGQTKVFIRHPEVLFGLEDARENYWHNVVNRIKNCFLCYKNFNHELASRVKRAFRTYKRFRIAQVEVIQDAFREYKGAAPFYDRRMDNEKRLQGKKERQRLSLLACRKFFGDYLDQNAARAIQDAMGSSERWIFSCKGNTIFKNKISPRFFVLTDQAFYAVMLVMTKGVGTLQTERRINLTSIERASMSPYGDNFMIIHTDIMEGDYVLEADFKTELLAWLGIKKNGSLQLGFFNDPKDPTKPIIHYKSKKVSQPGKTNAKLTVLPDLEAMRLKLKAAPTATTFFKSNKLYCLHGQPSSSSIKVITKQTGGPLVEAPAPIEILEQRVLRGHVAKRGGGAKVAGLEAALMGKPGPAASSSAPASAPASSPGDSGSAPTRAAPARAAGGAPRAAPGGAAPSRGAGGGAPRAAPGGAARAAPGGAPRAAPAGGAARPGGGAPRAAAGGAPRAAAGGAPARGAARPGAAPGGGAPAGRPAGRAAPGGGAPRRGGGPAAPAKPKCKALYDFDASQGDELSFREGDVMTIVSEDGDWFTAELNGQKGMIPANYVEKI